MKNLLCAILFGLTTLLVTVGVYAPAQAQTHAYDMPEQDSDDWGLDTSIGVAAVGVGGTIVGGIGGAAIGTKVASSLSGCDPDEFLGCFFELIVGGGLGGFAGVGLGAGTSVYLTGELLGYHGDLGASMGGAFIGAVASIPAFLWGAEAGLVSLAVLPAVGAMTGYYLTLQNAPNHRSAPTGALIGLGDDGIDLGVPAVGFSRTEEETRVDVSLFAGRF